MKHVRRSVLFGAAVLFALPFLPVQEAVVDRVVSQISTATDVELGEIAYEGLKLGGLWRRPEPLAAIAARVKRALAKVYPAASLEPFELTVSVVEPIRLWTIRKKRYAIGLPGGRVLATRQLSDLLTDNEITAVVAREYGHVLLRHAVKKLVHQELLRLLLRAALLPDADDNGIQEGFSAEIAGMLVKQAKVAGIATAQYSRAQDLEADQVAQAACRAGACSLDALSSAMARLQAARPLVFRYYDQINDLPIYRPWSKHPPIRVRTDALEQVRVPGLASTQAAPPFLAQAPQLFSNLTKQIRSFVPRLNDQIQRFVPRLNNQLRDVSKWDDAISEEEKSALKKIRSYWEKSLEK